MRSRIPGPKTKGQIGDMEVEDTKMQPNVPNIEIGKGLDNDVEPIIGGRSPEATIENIQKIIKNKGYGRKPKKPKRE
tara:strand:+ start:3298 stop:3528 length:231 start_codon:yes stop_codon:yes gene_type:complete